MSKPEDYQEEAAEPFNVADHLDEPQVIEAHIGNLLAEIDRLRALLADITAIAARG
jgi:DNA-binding phage protein